MRKLLIPLIITLLSLIGNNCFAQWTGAGTSASPYLITSQADLATLATRVNTNNTNYTGIYFKVNNDITMTGNFTPIGNVSSRSFRGIFNGNGKVISNLSISSGAYVGLFGNISGATIEDLGIVNANVATNSTANPNYIGGLIGYASNNSKVNECYVINSTISGNGRYNRVGGLVGYANGSTINECYAIAITDGGRDCRVGGLIGDATNISTINNSYARANVKNTSGTINGTRYYGGFVGYLEGNSKISNSYSAPTAFSASTGNRGLLVGGRSSTTSTITNSYYDNLLYTISFNSLGAPKSTAEMKTQPFAILLNVSCLNENWKYDNIPTLVNDGYPILFWQVGGSTLPPCLDDGSGTEEDPFRIRYVKDLIKLSSQVSLGTTFTNLYFIVENNINFHISGQTDSSTSFTPIGNATYSFQGKFNGNGKVISNLKKSGTSYMGLFGNILNATIEKLGIEGDTITTTAASSYGGALAGYARNSQINNCYVTTSTITGGGSGCRVGGLIGDAYGDTINNCYSRATINSSGSGVTRYYGGLVGYLEAYSIISNSYSSPTSLTSTVNRGSLVGGFINSSAVNSYYLNLGTMSAQPTGSTSMPDANSMKNIQFATDLNVSCLNENWKFDSVPTLVNGGFPILFWQIGGYHLPSCFNGGDGSEEDPFRIRYVKDLIQLSGEVYRGNHFLNSYFIVENNINFRITVPTDSSSLFSPIGDATNSFQGNFNGNGKVISNLTINSSLQYIGLFGKVEYNATIKNLGIESANITLTGSTGTNNYHAAGLVGHIGDNSLLCTLSGCYVSSSTIKGYGTKSTIAGLAGYAGNTIIKNCYSRANIIQGDYSTQNTNANNYYGGLVGYIYNSTISNSYSSPLSFTSKASNKGILVGIIAGTVTAPNSYYNSIYNVSGMTTLGISMTQAQMQNQQFAIDLNVSCQNYNWKYDNVTPLVNGGLPILYWQIGGSTLPPCFNEGDGTEDNPFRIRYVKDLVRLSTLVSSGNSFPNEYFHVESNINFTSNNPIRDSSLDFNPIGDDTYSFQGNFNGGGHVISNLTKNSGTYVGLFGYISNNATIDSLGIENFTLTSSNYLGGLVGYASGSNIKRSYSLASLTGSWGNTDIYIGGLIGYSDNCIINNCYSRAKISCSYGSYWNYSGGLIGDIENGSISNSYSVPDSILYGDYGGLLVGKNSSGFDFSTSYCLDIVIHQSQYGYGGIQNNSGIEKDSAEMRSGCFVVSLNNSQNPIAWFKAKSQVNLGYPVLSWQKLSDGITTAGFEGNCLSVTTFDGGQTNPYKVKYVKDLIYISNMVANDTTYSSKYFQMLNDINYNNGVIDSSSLYNPIGDFTNNKPFSGDFSGLRNAIANYSFSDTTKDNVGLFGYIKGATIKKLGISNISILARNNVGGLVGNMNANSTLDSCFVYGYINGVSNVGGLVGMVTTASCDILRSFTNTTIDAQTNVGGIVGNHSGGKIRNSYSNSEIYSSTSVNNYVGGIIGLASNASNIDSVYSVCKIIRNGTTNNNFGKIKGNSLGTLGLKCYSRDSVFVNYTNIDSAGYTYTVKNNADLRSSSFATSTLGSIYWKTDNDTINDGYPILKYQMVAVKPTANGTWPTTSASQVVIISGIKLKIEANSAPMAAYIKIQNGGLLQNSTNINFYGEYNRELYLGKWNLIGLSTYNRILSCLYNYADTTYKTFVKKFDYGTNNWQASTDLNNNTVININTPFNYNEGFLVMPNYSLDSLRLTKSRIVSKGVLYNENSFSYTFNNTSTLIHKLVSLANNYPASLTAATFINDNTSLIQGGLIYVYDADSDKWNNNLQSYNPITSIKPSEGFFIFANSASGSLSFAKSQLVSGAKNIIKSDLIYVKAFANNQEREAFLEFNDAADNGFDFNDGLMLFGSNYNAVEPFFKIPTQEINDSTTQLIKDAFSSLPYSTELDLRSQDNNDVSLEFSNISNGIYVYLIDSLLSKVQCLNENPYYNIKVSQGNNGNRLSVFFTYNKSDAKSFFNNSSSEDIRIWNNNKDLNIEGKDLVKYEIYDIMGNKLLEEGISSDKFQTLLSLKTGVYIVRVNSKTGLKSQKISVYSE